MSHSRSRLRVQMLIKRLAENYHLQTTAIFQAPDLLLEDDISDLMNALQRNTYLQSLTLTGMELTDDNAQMLEFIVREHPRLRELNVTKNKFSATFIETLIRSTLIKRVMKVLHIGEQAEPLTPEEEETITEVIEENDCLHVCTVNVTNPDYLKRIEAQLTANAGQNP